MTVIVTSWAGPLRAPYLDDGRVHLTHSTAHAYFLTRVSDPATELSSRHLFYAHRSDHINH